MDEPERERWRGSVDAKVSGIEEDVRTLFRMNTECAKDRQRLELLITALAGSVANLAVKIGLMSTIGAIVGAAVMQYVLSLLKH